MIQKKKKKINTGEKVLNTHEGIWPNSQVKGQSLDKHNNSNTIYTKKS